MTVHIYICTIVCFNHCVCVGIHVHDNYDYRSTQVPVSQLTQKHIIVYVLILFAIMEQFQLFI